MPARVADSATTDRPARPDVLKLGEAEGLECGEQRGVEEDAPADRPHDRGREHAARGRGLGRSVAVVLILVLLGALAGLLWGSSHPVEYQGRSDVLVESNVSLTGDMQTFEVTERDVTTQQTLIASPTVVGDASRRAGVDLSDAVTVSAAPDSNILTMQAIQPTRDGAREATEAYVRSYLALVGERQRLQVDAQMKLARDSDEAASEALDRLDGAVADSPVAQQPVLLSLQSSERSSLAQQQRDSQDKVARLKDAASRLPVNLQRVDAAPRLTPSGFSGRTWILLGAAAGLVVAVMVLARLAERRP